MKKLFLFLALLSFTTLTGCDLNDASKTDVKDPTQETTEKEDNPNEDGEHTIEFGWI